MKPVSYCLFRDEYMKFFYSEQTVHCVNYNCNKIFFLNNYSITEHGEVIYENFYADFNSEDLQKTSGNLIVEKFSFYLEDNRDCLVDFSLSSSEKNLFLLWGYFKNSNKINEDLFVYEIKQKKWKKIKLYNRNDMKNEFFGHNISFFPRLKSSSTCFYIKSNLKSYIFVFGGYCTTEKNKKDIYNLVEKIEVIDGEDIANIISFPKKSYKDTYKPLWDSQLVAIGAQSKEILTFYMMMFGGTFDKFLYNQDNKNLLIYQIKIEFSSIGPELENMVYFQQLMKTNVKTNSRDGLNLLFATQNKNYFYNNQENKIGIMVNFISRQEKGIFFEFNENNHLDDSLELQINSDNIPFVNLASKKYFKKTELEIAIEKKERSLEKQKFFYLTLKFDQPFRPSSSKVYLINKIQKKPIFEQTKINYLKNFFGQECFFENLLIEENISELIFQIPKNKTKKDVYEDNSLFHYVGFSANELKKKNYNYIDYIPSKLKLSNYSLSNNILYILINNEKDTEGKRILYSLDLKTINLNSKNRLELEKIIEDSKFFFFENCSVLAENNFIYVVGGQINRKKLAKYYSFAMNNEGEETITNFVYDLKESRINYFLSNLAEMKNPYVISSKESFFCINRKLITNPYLEIVSNFPSESFSNRLKDFKNGGNYLYGEFISKTNLKQWNAFLIDVEDLELSFGYNSEKEKFIPPKNTTSFNYSFRFTTLFIFLGKIPKKEMVGFLHSYKSIEKKGNNIQFFCF